MSKIVLGTRGSKLALAQTEKVLRELKGQGYEVEIRIIKTAGDIMKDKPLHEFRGMGAFVRIIDESLDDGDIDIAVHSMKDVPSKIKGVIAAVLERESPCDAFVTRDGTDIDELKSYAVVGTSSLRRVAQLKMYRSDFRIENLRGNVDTRLRKLNEGQYDAILLAEAGLIRIGMTEKVKYQSLNPQIFVPSANQGIIAVETRKGEEDLVSFMNHEKTYLEAMIEREVIKELGIGCAVPAGIFAKFDGKIELICEILSFDGSESVRVEETLNPDTAIEEAKEVARELKKKGGSLIARG
ncbi:MAG TPA: hydroxymethylbilane synthase [Archaeoglobaceae archaeon]|nr:hydroxymethylbilane synthase [Archaeoglobaceae archaeon]